MSHQIFSKTKNCHILFIDTTTGTTSKKFCFNCKQKLDLHYTKSVADLGARGAQILSISCSFRENLAISYVGAPPPSGELAPPGEILDPPLQVEG